MSFFNPFTQLSHLRARIYRTPFGQKFVDTLLVFAGSMSHPLFAGIFDYVTLGIPRFLLWSLVKLDDFLNTINPQKLIGLIIVGLSQLISGVLTLLLALPRFLFGLTMAIICLPLIGVIHALSMKKGHELKESIRSSQVMTDEYKLYFAVLSPCESVAYNNCFLFLVNKDELWYYGASGNSTPKKIQIEKDQVPLFRTTFQVEQIIHTLGHALLPIPVKKKLLKQFLSPNAALSETYYSVAELLKAENTTLEDIESSKLTVNVNDAHEKEITLSFRQDKKIIPAFFLSAKNPADRSLLQNIRELNIGEIEAAIEQSPVSSRDDINPLMATPK